ncbi:LuxR C-terminal-related transcriptional regulator [Microbacterium amylolyticum]|uniref:DNA-binding NarL/FixJ family response regulator n=1 Tax=Microbacterium amylolyticum TaxID=936337 RepID=A0ABS4ZGT5_9MICO|nr:LuxR C-terminal-related transcriptional regulator [Microbacterium amylolyticum]MBP2436496.1 DNA-binding NarL/FixJ family response regulator [Microbacterium amylolyticum]
MPNAERLRRSRLVSLWERVTPGATVLVTAQHRSGIATSVRQWLDGSDRTLVQWSSNRTEVPRSTPDADVVLLELEGMREPHAIATKAVRERWPLATLIAVTSTQWPPLLVEEDIRPERVISGALFGFTAEETIDRAEQLGLTLTWDEATHLLDRVGTHAGFVDAVLTAAATRGALDDAAVRIGCDAATAHFSSSAAAGVFQPNGWNSTLMSARIGAMPRQTMLSVWGRDEVVRAALDNILQSGFFREDLETGTLELRPDIREAVQNRIEREAQADLVDELVTDLASGLLSEGNAEDGWNVVADLPGARTRMLERHWWQLSELDVARARPWLEAAVHRSDAPELRVALARTLIDVTVAGHSGAVGADARDEAAQLLDQAATSGILSESLGLIADTLRGVLLRLGGRYTDANEAHEALANRSAVPSGDLADAPTRCALIQANVMLQAGLSAFDASRTNVAADRFAAAAALAHSADHARVAGFAHEMLLVLSSKHQPIAATFQGLVDNLLGARVASRPMETIVSAWSALYVTDPAALQAVLDDVDAASFDDPLALRLIAVTLRTVAHGLLETSGIAMRRLELIENDLDDRQLTHLHHALLLWARTESLVHVGASDRAIELLTAAPELHRRVVPVDILLARAYLKQNQPERAIAALSAAPDPKASGILMMWSNVLLFLAYQTIGSESSGEVAQQHLGAAIAAASRSRPVLPFAMQGMTALNTTITQAEHLGLDPAGRRFTDDLIRVRDSLQMATGATLALSDRERTVIEHLGAADSVRHLAQLLHVSPNTVKTQLRSIYRKLGVSSWTDAIETARRLGLIQETA